MAGDVVRIKVGISVNYIAGSTREDEEEIPRAEWEAMSADEQEAFLNTAAEMMIENHVNAWATVVED